MGSGKGESLQTLKLRATVNGVPVVVLIDSGATHNFITKPLVSKLGWKVEMTPDFRIKLGDGFQTITRGKCTQVVFQSGEVRSEIEAYLFDLEGLDMVLGMSWLKSLGDMVVNWRKQTMEFWHEKKWVMLKGIEGTPEAISALQNIVGKASKGYGV
ncbi:RNA-directed DNA polymerase (Reverse transcriptase), partial [Trifolium medium]|nr:RNA-directed DNA polymerase (Reverse transcriptase) [Trifolium medium]